MEMNVEEKKQALKTCLEKKGYTFIEIDNNETEVINTLYNLAQLLKWRKTRCTLISTMCVRLVCLLL